MKEEEAPIYSAGAFRSHGDFLSLPFYISKKGSSIAYLSLVEKVGGVLRIKHIKQIQVDERPVEDEFHTTFYKLQKLIDTVKRSSSLIQNQNGHVALSVRFSDFSHLKTYGSIIFIYYFPSVSNNGMSDVVLDILNLKMNRGRGEVYLLCFTSDLSECINLDEVSVLEIHDHLQGKTINIQYEVLSHVWKSLTVLKRLGRADVKSYPIFMNTVTYSPTSNNGQDILAGDYIERLIGSQLVAEKRGITRFIPSPGYLTGLEKTPAQVIRDVAIISLTMNLEKAFAQLVDYYDNALAKAIELLLYIAERRRDIPSNIGERLGEVSKSLSTTRSSTTNSHMFSYVDPKVTLKLISDPAFYYSLFPGRTRLPGLYKFLPITYIRLHELSKTMISRLPTPLVKDPSGRLSHVVSGRYLVTSAKLKNLKEIYQDILTNWIIMEELAKSDPIYIHSLIIASAIQRALMNIQPKDSHVLRLFLGFPDLTSRVLATRALVLGLHGLSHIISMKVAEKFNVHRHSNWSNWLSEFISIETPLGVADPAIKKLGGNETNAILLDGVILYLEGRFNHQIFGSVSIAVKKEGSSLKAHEYSKYFSIEEICDDTVKFTGESYDYCYEDWMHRRHIYAFGVKEVLRSTTQTSASKRMEELLSEDFPAVRDRNTKDPIPKLHPPLSIARELIKDSIKSPLNPPEARLIDPITLSKVPACFDGCYACIMHDGCAYRYYDLRLLLASKFMAKLICKHIKSQTSLN